ncbi:MULTISPECIES: hypothetical protein [Streptacidiphilus]|uniref:Uncharacterized protein n=1 Tax=Streptacidiphilus cavernicola TaxID=3342716 RepID=A0ABV6UGK4_9ACTN|nr:hypothetical protein [Streptacidiphilus jeojiense]
MSNGPAPDNAAKPLPRRGADTPGRIPTQYGPGNPVAETLTESQYRVRPGAPNLPIPEPQRAAEPDGEPSPMSFAVRPGTPDASVHEEFQAMLDRQEAASARRRRQLWLGTALVAVLVLVGTGATLLTTRPAKQSAAASPSAAAPTASAPADTAPAIPVQQTPTDTPSPTAVPSALAPTTAVDPATLLGAAATDTAPLSAVTLFPGKSVTVDNHSYTQALTTASACVPAVTPNLAAVLTKYGCRKVFRASYATGTTAVTVGVGVFDSAAQAAAVKAQATAGNLEPLSGGALPAFCHAVACRLSVNAYGRYAYFTVAGYTTGKPVPAADTSALAAGTDMGRMVFENLLARARGEATAKN